MLRPPKPGHKNLAPPASASSDQLERWLEDRLCRKNELWRDSSQEGSSAWRYYCPFCGISRALAGPPRPSARHFGKVVLTALVGTAVCWPIFGAKGLFLILPFWIAFEVLYRIRVRAELDCNQCGFDPVLYLSDVQLARREMKAFWEKKLVKPGGGVSERGAPASSSDDSPGDDNPSLTAQNAES